MFPNFHFGKYTLLWLLLVVLCFYQNTNGDPAISSISGSPNYGGLITLKGKGFGHRGDFHPDADKLIRMWDDFESGDFKTNSYSPWIIFQGAGQPLATHVVKDSTTCRKGMNNHYLYRRNNTNLGFVYIPGQTHSEYYQSFWIRLSDKFNVCEGGQFKVTRIVSRNCGVNIYPNYRCDRGVTRWSMVTEGTTPQIMFSQGYSRSLTHTIPSGWHRWDIYLKKSTNYKSNDGCLKVFLDTKEIYDFKENTGNRYHNGMNFDSDSGDLAKMIALGAYFNTASPQTFADFDDVYFDHSISRVELGDSPCWSSCTHAEVQIPQKWSDSSIRFVFNQGTFKTGSTAYLFVFDSRGTASAGMPVVIRKPNALASMSISP